MALIKDIMEERDEQLDKDVCRVRSKSALSTGASALKSWGATPPDTWVCSLIWKPSKPQSQCRGVMEAYLRRHDGISPGPLVIHQSAASLSSWRLGGWGLWVESFLPSNHALLFQVTIFYL